MAIAFARFLSLLLQCLELKSKDYIKINTILSPTPLLIKSSSDIIVSAIYEKDTSDDTNQKVLVRDFNPRILYSKNIPLTNGKTIVLRDPNYPNAGDITLGEIYNINFQPYCGHIVTGKQIGRAHV